jgi:hypothetical protein
MQITVEAVTREPRVFQGKTQWGVKLPGNGGWVTLYRDAKPVKGEVIEVNTTERHGKNGMVYVDAFPVMPPLAPSSNGAAPTHTTAADDTTWNNNTGKKVSWDAYRAMAEAAHELASKLEPDAKRLGPNDDGMETFISLDRSTARAAILNTVMIAYSNGKIYVLAVDDDIPW